MESLSLTLSAYLSCSPLARYGRVYICQGLSGRVIPQVGDPTVHRPYVRGVHLPSGVCVGKGKGYSHVRAANAM